MTALETPTELITERFDRSPAGLTRSYEIAGKTYSSTVDVDAPTDDDRGDWWWAFIAGRRPSPVERRGTVRSLDLFCGPGGLALGFGQAARELGYSFVSEAAVDADAGAVDVYASNHETRQRSSRSVKEMIDFQVRGQADKARFRYAPEVIADELSDLRGHVDVILAGPPCQGHSNLNNHTRRTDRRNELYLTVPAFAIAADASMVVIENVPAVIHDRQQVVATTTRLLEDNGYEVSTGRIMADRIGWPQTRQRFFLLARKGHAPLAPDVVQAAIGEPVPRSVWWAIADLADRVADDPMMPEVGLSDENRARIDWLFDNDEFNLPPSERPECHQDGTTYNAVYGRLFRDKPAPTITSGFMTPGRGRYIHPTQRRTLTPREAARIQGFPDNYVFHPDSSRPSSKAQLGKWIGDAVPMPLGHAAGIAVLGAAPIEII